jgi:hypothetical protein
MKADTSRAIFSKHNKIMCHSILADLDNWISAKFVDANNNVAFCKSVAVLVHTSTINQRKIQTQVKYNAYASHIYKRFRSENYDEAIESCESFDTAPNHIPRRCINLTYVDVVVNASPMKEQVNTPSNDNASIAAPPRTQDTTSVVYIDN